MCVRQSLVGQPSAQALLDLDTTAVDEPFNSSVMFGCIPPGKRYRPVEDLSGGEKTMAAIALLFATQSYDSLTVYRLHHFCTVIDFVCVSVIIQDVYCLTKSSAVTERPHDDALCVSVVSFNSTIRLLFVTSVSGLPLRTIKFYSVLFGVVVCTG